MPLKPSLLWQSVHTAGYLLSGRSLSITTFTVDIVDTVRNHPLVPGEYAN
jgi:hypothetical protein